MQVVSALLLSIIRYISTNICVPVAAVRHSQKMDKMYLWKFLSWFWICQLWGPCEEQYTDQQTYNQNFVLYPVLFQKLDVLLKAIASHAVAKKILYKVIQIWQTRAYVFLTLKVILLSTSKTFLVYKTLDLVDK